MTPGSAGVARRLAALARRLPAVLLLLVLAGGVALRVSLWSRADSLWIDELRLVNNVVERPLPELLSRRIHGNAHAPLGYLAVERGLYRLFGRSEPALRLLGLLASVAGLGLAAVVARRLCGRFAAVLPLALLAFGAPLVAFAADVRPYALDATAVLLDAWLALRWLERPGRGRAWPLALALFALPWFSYGSAFASLGTVAALAIARFARTRRAAAGPLGLFALAAASGTAGSLLLAWRFSSDDAATHEALFRFWVAAGGLPPEGLGPLGLGRWLLERAAAIAEFPFRPVTAGWPEGLVLPLLALGGWALWRVSRPGLLLVVLPMVGCLAGGALGVYPAAGRLALVAAPAAALLVGALAGAVERSGRRGPAVAALLVVVASAPWLRLAPGLARTPAVGAGRELVAAVAGEVERGDRLYVFYSAEPALRFYAPRFALDLGAAEVGECESWWRREALERSFSGPPGTRQWVLFSSARPSEAEWLDRSLGRRAELARRIDFARGGRWVESLRLYVLGERDPDAPAESAKGLEATIWRCGFFESP